MNVTKQFAEMATVNRCTAHGASPIPQEGSFGKLTNADQICAFSHGVGTCSTHQGACKLTLNVKEGVIEECLVEVIGCSGMTQSACMAAEILPGKKLIEALNTDLVCDAINVAMREVFLNMAYGRSQTAFSDDGLPIGAGLEDLGSTLCSQVGTSYGSKKGPRYLEVSEGYIQEMALDDKDRAIGYKYVNVGKLMSLLQDGVNAEDALAQSTGASNRFSKAARTINPRKE